MAQYGIVSDAHGNLEALESVWAELARRSLTDRMILNAGDSVAYGRDSAACIDFFRSHSSVVTVGGNYDFNVASYPDRQAKFQKKWALARPEKLEYIREASSQISSGQRAWLTALPKRLELMLDGKSVALGHYSPIGEKIGLGSWTTDEELAEVAIACPYDVIVSGHTHTPFVRWAAGTLFINPGSVGRSWGLPTFAVMTIADGRVDGEIMT